MQPVSKLLTLLIFLFIGLAIPSDTFADPDDHELLRGKAAGEVVHGAELVRMSYDRGIPSYVRFAKGEGIPLNKFRHWLKKEFKSFSDQELRIEERNRGQLEQEHVHFHQYHNGIRVKGGECIAHVENGTVRSFNGILFSSFDRVSASPSVSKSAARKAALRSIGAKRYKWEVPGAEKWLEEFTGNPDTSWFPEGELTIAPTDGNVQQDPKRLAYRFNIYAHEPVSRAHYYVDATSGELLFQDAIIKHVDDTGTAVTGYSGSRTIVADSTGSNSYRLRESGRGNGIETYDMNEGTDYNNAVDFMDSDNYWNNANADEDEYAGDAHWGAEMTYDYLWQKHGRNSIDDNGFALVSYVHYDQDYGNAFWDGQRMTYGDGSSGNAPLTALDICAHEVTHGLTSRTADLVYQDEPGALNESFSDIFGNSVEYFAKPSNASWEVGEDIGGIRNMADPKSYGDPDTYKGTDWYTGNGDNGGVHTNSGVQNYWYYLMVEGGSGTNSVGDNYSVTSVGWDTAAAIAYRNLVHYLGTGSEYADARFYAIQSAIDLYGACSQPHESTANAWYAVNVGNPFTSYVVADFEVKKDRSCNAPFTVEFQPLTSNASDFVWFFGDGDSSSTQAPTHTYTDTGSYDVELRVSGGCGNDTMLVQDRIEIGPSFHCRRSMPVNGKDTIEACRGTLFDNGGSDGNYPNQEDSYYTIDPPNAKRITLNFKNFDVEAGDAGFCNYDYLEIFDGTSSTDSSLGAYCNTTGSPGIVRSTGGAITLHLHSDQYVNGEGFELEWYCSGKDSTAPVADFTVDDTINCNSVRFYDLSHQGDSLQHYWKFGDGDSSSAQDPLHTYDQTGSYSVELLVSNDFGKDSVLKQDLVHVQVPEISSTQGDRFCEGTSAELHAEARNNGHIHWYGTKTGDSLLGTSDTLVTAPLSSSTDFYAEARLPALSRKVGAVDNTFGSGSDFDFDQHLVFDADTSFTLLSVKVYANGGKYREIELRDESGTVLQDKVVYIPDGQQRVQLDFEVPEGTDHQLGVNNDSLSIDLFRNDAGANYPYEDDQGIVRIKESSAGSAPEEYYYFFYDWEIRGPDCVGPREKVEATLDVCGSIEGKEEALSLDIRPNPSQGQFLLEGSLLERKGTEIRVRDSYGRIVHRNEAIEGKRKKLDLSEEAPGIYFLTIRNEEGSRTEKLVIKD